MYESKLRNRFQAEQILFSSLLILVLGMQTSETVQWRWRNEAANTWRNSYSIMDLAFVTMNHNFLSFDIKIFVKLLRNLFFSIKRNCRGDDFSRALWGRIENFCLPREYEFKSLILRWHFLINDDGTQPRKSLSSFTSRFQFVRLLVFVCQPHIRHFWRHNCLGL